VYRLIRCVVWTGHECFGWIIDSHVDDYDGQYYAEIRWFDGEETTEQFETYTYYAIQGTEWRLLRSRAEWREYLCK
jgi:hypothetical protein